MNRLETTILTPDFFRSAWLVLRMSMWARKEWDEQLDAHLIEARKSEHVSIEVENTIRDQNSKTECGRLGVAGVIWYTLNKNRYPDRKIAEKMIMDAAWHLFAVRVADNWVDEGTGGSCLDRLKVIQPNERETNTEHPLAGAAIYLLNECERKFAGRRGYMPVCNRLFSLVNQVELDRNIVPSETLEKLDKNVCLMTLLPVAFLTEPFADKPKRQPTLALRGMLYAARLMDYLGDLKRDFFTGDTYNGVLHRARNIKPNGDYGEIRKEVERLKPELINKAKREIRDGAKGLESVASGMHWFASMLMCGKYLAQYELLSRDNSDDLSKIARKFVRSF